MEVALDEADLALLRDFLAVARGQGVRPMLIGAGARRLSLELRRNISGARATKDWDFGVRIGSWAEWTLLRDRLIAEPGPLFEKSSQPHRLVHRRGRLLDIVPFGGIESTPGEITWPDKMRMSVRGLAESERLTEAIEVEPGLCVDVASVPSWALLKLEAYRDRRQRGETKDIQDFAWLLDNYEQAGDELRVHDELSHFVQSDLIAVEDAGAMLLGKDVAAAHTRAMIGPLAAVLVEAEDPYSRLVNDVLAGRYNPDREVDLRARICRRMGAFMRGLDVGA